MNVTTGITWANRVLILLLLYLILTDFISLAVLLAFLVGIVYLGLFVAVVFFTLRQLLKKP